MNGSASQTCGAESNFSSSEGVRGRIHHDEPLRLRQQPPLRKAVVDLCLTEQKNCVSSSNSSTPGDASPAIYQVPDLFRDEAEHWGCDVGQKARDDGPELLIICREVQQKVFLSGISFSFCRRYNCYHILPNLPRASGAVEAQRSKARAGERANITL